MPFDRCNAQLGVRLDGRGCETSEKHTRWIRARPDCLCDICKPDVAWATAHIAPRGVRLAGRAPTLCLLAQGSNPARGLEPRVRGSSTKDYIELIHCVGPCGACARVPALCRKIVWPPQTATMQASAQGVMQRRGMGLRRGHGTPSRPLSGKPLMRYSAVAPCHSKARSTRARRPSAPTPGARRPPGCSQTGRLRLRRAPLFFSCGCTPS